MSVTRKGAVVILAMAVVLIATSSAGAAPATPAESHWIVGGTKLASGDSNLVECHLSSGSNLIFESQIVGTPLKITATGVKCLTGAKILQTATMAEDVGKFEFTAVTVDEPAGCTVLGGKIETERLVSAIQEEGATVYDLFEPEVLGGRDATISIRGCAAEGNYPVTGFFFGRSPNATGVEKQEQVLTFDASTAAVSALQIGGNAANITGQIAFELEKRPLFGAVK